MDTLSSIRELLQFVTDHAASKNDCVKHLESTGIPTTLAEDVVFLSPIAFVRASAADSGIRFSNRFIFLNADGSVVRTGDLRENEVYRTALQNSSQLAEHPAFESVRKTCSESDLLPAIQEMGLDPKDVSTGPYPLWLAPPTDIGRERALPLLNPFSRRNDEALDSTKLSKHGNFDKSAVRIMQLANQLALKDARGHVTLEHVLVALCQNRDSRVTEIFAQFKVSAESITSKLRSSGQMEPKSDTPGVASAVNGASRHATEIASTLGAKTVGVEHVLLGILFEHDSIACKVLESVGMRYDTVLAQIKLM